MCSKLVAPSWEWLWKVTLLQWLHWKWNITTALTAWIIRTFHLSPRTLPLQASHYAEYHTSMSNFMTRKVARMKLQYFGHITRGSAGNLALTVLEGRVDGLHHQGRPKRQWMDDIEEWSGCSYIQLKEMSQDRAQWRRKTIEWSSAVANRHRRWSTSEWVSEWCQTVNCFQTNEHKISKYILDTGIHWMTIKVK